MRPLVILLVTVLVIACDHQPHDVSIVDTMPPIYPDYVDVTIPATIAPLNFDVLGDEIQYVDVTITGERQGELHLSGTTIDIPLHSWHTLLTDNIGSSLTVTVTVKRNDKWLQYQPFHLFISSDALTDWGVTYRRIAPGYEVYGRMGLYQRELTTFRETAIITNSLLPGACYNCHTPNRANPEQFTFHVRGEHGATVIHDTTTDLLQAVNDSIHGALVYPYWHPSGQYCAYSTNTTRQGFHELPQERIEVFDQASDILLYHPATHEILVDSLLATTDHYETYPVFSPDGTTLYFCSANSITDPQDYQHIQYNLCSVAFDTATAQFVGPVDTLVNAIAMHKSVAHPRPSYDGKYVMFTLSDYGCFPIWHKEADNYLLRLDNNELLPMTNANSDNTDSYHNWDTTSRWVVFTSRRDDGLYSRLYICHINADGTVDKPFLLPQRHPKAFYDNLLDSYNTPDFTVAPVNINQRSMSKHLADTARIRTTVRHISHRQ